MIMMFHDPYIYIPHSPTDQRAQPNPTLPTPPYPPHTLPPPLFFSTSQRSRSFKFPNVTCPTVGAHDVKIPAKCPPR